MLFSVSTLSGTKSRAMEFMQYLLPVGADVGTQYRSVIFYANEEQKKEAQSIIDQLNAKKVYPSPVVTSLEPLAPFYKAEDYHQNYYENNKSQPYCQMVIQPKIEKFEKIFKARLKK